MSALVDSYREHISKLVAGSTGARIRTIHGWCSSRNKDDIKRSIQKLRLGITSLENR